MLAHSAFLDQLDNLIAAVEEEQRRDPDEVTPNQKALASIVELAFDAIPSDPTRREYRQGDTLGARRKHWFRAKFGGGRFRLFFRYRSDARIIVLAWVNDSDTLRTYGSRDDAYAVFSRMLDDGCPPDEWDALLAEARIAAKRFRLLRPRPRGQ